MDQSKEEKVLIGAYVTASERERLRELAKREDLAMSQVIRRALRVYLDQVDIEIGKQAQEERHRRVARVVGNSYVPVTPIIHHPEEA